MQIDDLKVGQVVEWRDVIEHDGRSAKRTLSGTITAIDGELLTITKATGNTTQIDAARVRRILKEASDE